MLTYYFGLYEDISFCYLCSQHVWCLDIIVIPLSHMSRPCLSWLPASYILLLNEVDLRCVCTPSLEAPSLSRGRAGCSFSISQKHPCLQWYHTTTQSFQACDNVKVYGLLMFPVFVVQINTSFVISYHLTSALNYLTCLLCNCI